MSEEKLTVKLEAVSFYDFEDKDTKKRITGAKAYFQEMTPENTDFAKGYIQKNSKIDIEVFNRLVALKFPVMCEPVLASRFTQKGVKTEIVDFVPVNK